MTQHFNHQGISFQYPASWRLEREENENGWSVSLQSPGTAFLFLSCDETMPTTEDVSTTALEALREEYPELEAEPCIEKLAGQTAIGHDIQFFHFDLTNNCWTRSIYSASGTLCLLCQVADLEEEIYGPALRAVCASLHLDDDE